MIRAQKITTWFRHCLPFWITVAISLLFAWCYLIDPYVVLRGRFIVVQKVEVVNPTVSQGSQLILHYVMDVKRGGDVVLERYFDDSLRYYTPPLIIHLDAGRQDRIVAVDIPHSLPPGEYQASEVVQEKINLMDRQTVSLPHVTFTVTRAGDS